MGDMGDLIHLPPPNSLHEVVAGDVLYLECRKVKVIRYLKGVFGRNTRCFEYAPVEFPLRRKLWKGSVDTKFRIVTRQNH